MRGSPTSASTFSPRVEAVLTLNDQPGVHGLCKRLTERVTCPIQASRLSERTRAEGGIQRRNKSLDRRRLGLRLNNREADERPAGVETASNLEVFRGVRDKRPALRPAQYEWPT